MLEEMLITFLKDRDDVLNVFIHGDMPEKVQRIMVNCIMLTRS